jgi:uncharacterized protein
MNNSYRVTQGGHSSFKHVCRNIKNLQDKYPEYFSKMVSFNAVIHDKNSAGETIEFISDNFDKIPLLSELNTNGIKENMLDKFNRTFKNVTESLQRVKDQEELESKMKNAYPKNSSLVRFLHQYSGNVYKNYNSLFCEQKDIQFIPTGTCFPFSKRIFLTVGGKILPCERIGHQYSLGYVSENKVSLSPENIADKYNKYFDKLLKTCSTCYITEHCIQCIFNIKDLDENPVCHGFMPETKFKDFIAGNMRFLQEKPERYRILMTEVLIQ